MLIIKSSIFFFIFLFLLSYTSVKCDIKKVKLLKLGFFYDDVKENIENYVSNAVSVINSKLIRYSMKFEITIYKVEPTKSYQLTKTLCSLLNDGQLAIIGLGNSMTLSHLESVTTLLNIPFISIKWRSNEEENKNNKFSLNMHTPSSKIMHAVIDLCDHYNWDFITILYHEKLGLERIQDLIRIPNHLKLTKMFTIQVKQLSENMNEWVYMLKDMKLSGSSHIIVDIDTKYINEFIKQASEVGLMTSYFHFLFTSLDLSVLTYTPAANITAFQVYRPHDPKIESLLNEWNKRNLIRKQPVENFLMSEAIMIYDTLQLLANTIINNDLINSLNLIPSIVSCTSRSKWSYGERFIGYLKTANFTGLTGQVSFDAKSGERDNLNLYIVDIAKNGVDLFGYWTELKESMNKSIHVIRSYTQEKDQVMDRLNKNLIITTKLEAPYVMRKQVENDEKLIGNDQYEGYCIDLLEKIAKICGFNYTIKLVEDNRYGTIVDGKWNGLVKDLIDKKADLAVAALTANFQREQVIDFTKPFLNLGISILYRRPKKDQPHLFSFLLPLSIDIWLYMIAAYLCVSFMLFVLARFSPYEWENPHPCSKDSGIVENQFTVSNSLWFTIGSLMQQGTDINPRSPSIRLISCVWQFFTLILISSYTANLAAFLTVQRLKSPIENVEDLSKQTDIKYGSLKGGSTEQFFIESSIQTYERMWKFMSSNPDVFVNSTEEGIERVKTESYAFLLESTMNEYARSHDCDLMQIGGLLDSKDYGIGTPTGSPWRDQISNAILKLQEDGLLQYFHTKWWKEQKGTLDCENSDDKKKDSANELGIANVGGVFVVLVIGLCVSIIVAILEFLWKARQATHENISMTKKLFRDCKFALCYFKKTKKSSSHYSSKHHHNLQHGIKVIPSSSATTDINRTISYSSLASSNSTTQMIVNKEPFSTVTNRPTKKTPQLQHMYLK